MPRGISDKRAIRLALYYAIEWEQSSIAAYLEPRKGWSEERLRQYPLDAETQEHIERWRGNIRAFKRCLDRYFGGYQAPSPKGKTITLQELLRDIHNKEQED